MDKLELSEGKGRTAVKVSAHFMGGELVLFIYNKQAHIGAVAVADYEHKEGRASTSVITRLGHKEDAVARNAAHTICKRTQKPVCVIAGIHLDNITETEITHIVRNCTTLVDRVLQELCSTQ